MLESGDMNIAYSGWIGLVHPCGNWTKPTCPSAFNWGNNPLKVNPYSRDPN